MVSRRSVYGAVGGSRAAVQVLGDELITNGTFNSNTTGWTASTATLSAVNGKMRVTGLTGGSFFGRADQSFTTEIGATYLVSLDVTNIGACGFRVGTSAGGTQIFSQSATEGETNTKQFVATGTTTWLSIVDVSGADDYCEVDNVSVKKVFF